MKDKIINRILEINNKWKKKYNRLCTQYETLANEKIKQLELQNEILTKNIQYRDDIESLKEEIMQYRRKYGRLKGSGKVDKSKNKG
jgi:transposase-like protein